MTHNKITFEDVFRNFRFKKNKIGGKKMNKKVKKISGLISTALLTVSLAACGGSESASTTSSDNEIIFWNPFVGADSKNMKNMIDEYNKTNPEFKVKNVAMKEQDMYAKINTVYNSGKGMPDINIVHAERIQNYVKNDMLEPLDKLISGYAEINAENYVKSAWDIGGIDAKRYSVPLDVHTWVTYYNKSLVEKYGPNVLDDQIVTYDEIKEVGELAKKDKVAAMGLSWMKPNFLELYNQMGGEITSDGVTPTLNNDIAADTFILLNELYKSGYTNKDGEDASQLFQMGKEVFLPEGIWFQNTANTIKGFEWGMTHAPQYDANNVINWSSSHQFVMFNNDERSDEKEQGIVAFMDWIRENSIEWAKAGQNPASLATLEDPEYLALPQSFLVKDEVGQSSLKIFEYQYNGYVSDEIDRIGFDTVFGKTKIDKALESAQKSIEDKIAQDK